MERSFRYQIGFQVRGPPSSLREACRVRNSEECSPPGSLCQEPVLMDTALRHGGDGHGMDPRKRRFVPRQEGQTKTRSFRPETGARDWGRIFHESPSKVRGVDGTYLKQDGENRSNFKLRSPQRKSAEDLAYGRSRSRSRFRQIPPALHESYLRARLGSRSSSDPFAFSVFAYLRQPPGAIARRDGRNRASGRHKFFRPF